jgi:hypothetical protein
MTHQLMRAKIDVNLKQDKKDLGIKQLTQSNILKCKTFRQLEDSSSETNFLRVARSMQRWQRLTLTPSAPN